MIKTYDFYADPGHGWAKVKISELVALGIHNTISAYSYKKGDYAYLEEDCDLTRLYEAQKARGVEVKLREHVARERYSRIRNYDRYVKF